jgi:Ca2+-binding EF-hand superfamily protein
LIRTFLKIDQLEDGEIDEKELAQGLIDYLRMDRKNAENGAREIMQKIDLDGSGNISFSCRHRLI